MSRLLNIPDHDYDNRDFKEQMADLNVPIESTGEKKTAKALTGWVTARGYKAVQDMRINKTIVSFSEKAAKLFEVEKGVYRFSFCLVEYKGGTALLLKPDKRGIKLKKYERSICYITTHTGAMKKLFKEHNVKTGNYKIHETGKGWMAVYDD